MERRAKEKADKEKKREKVKMSIWTRKTRVQIACLAGQVSLKSQVWTAKVKVRGGSKPSQSQGQVKVSSRPLRTRPARHSWTGISLSAREGWVPHGGALGSRSVCSNSLIPLKIAHFLDFLMILMPIYISLHIGTHFSLILNRF